MIVKPVCVACRCFLRPEKNGYAFVEGMPNNLTVDRAAGELSADQIRGNRFPEAWSPYKLWRGDLWKCPDCGFLLVVGVIAGPVAEHYQVNFKQLVAHFEGDQLQVNDC